MNKKGIHPITKIFSLLFSSLQLLLPIFCTIWIFRKGPEPEKHLSQTQMLFTQTLEDLRPFGSEIPVKITVGEKEYRNLFQVIVKIANTGAAPILSDDFHEPLSVSVPRPWEIVAIKNNIEVTDQSVKLTWNWKSQQRFESTPALLNPGDQINVVLYLTNPDLAPLTVLPMNQRPSIKWDARITNLRAISTSNDALENYLLDLFITFNGFYTLLAGKSLWFVFAFGSINLATLLHLSVKTGVIARLDSSAIAVIVGYALLSACMAESLAYFVFGDPVFNMLNMFRLLTGDRPVGISWANIPCLAANIVLLMILCLRPAWLKDLNKPRRTNKKRSPIM